MSIKSQPHVSPADGSKDTAHKVRKTFSYKTLNPGVTIINQRQHQGLMLLLRCDNEGVKPIHFAPTPSADSHPQRRLTPPLACSPRQRLVLAS